jgi:DNA ligase 4
MSSPTKKGLIQLHFTNGRAQLKKDLFIQILKATSSLEQKWLIRIILKDMKISHVSIMNAFHPNAMKIYNECTNLQEVCEKCVDPNFKCKIFI